MSNVNNSGGFLSLLGSSNIFGAEGGGGLTGGGDSLSYLTGGGDLSWMNLSAGTSGSSGSGTSDIGFGGAGGSSGGGGEFNPLTTGLEVGKDDSSGEGGDSGGVMGDIMAMGKDFLGIDPLSASSEE